MASDEESYVKQMLKSHVKEARWRTKYYRNPNNIQYGYYGGGLLSNYDMFPEHQRSVLGLRKATSTAKKPPKEKKANKKMLNNNKVKSNLEYEELELDDFDPTEYEFEDEFDSKPASPKSMRRKLKAGVRTPEIMAARRRKVWQLMAKKELGKVQRARANNHKELISNCKKVSDICALIRCCD